MIWLVVPVSFAADQSDLEEIFSEVQEVRSDIQKYTTSYLLIYKKMESGRSDSSGTDDEKPPPSPASDPELRAMAEQMYQAIQNQKERAETLFAQFEKSFEELEESENSGIQSIYTAYENSKEKIQTNLAYTEHYYSKLLPYQAPEITERARQDISYKGTASLRLGTSSYEENAEESTTSRNLNLNGSVIFNPRSRLNINMNHNSDVVQTPFTSNDINLAFQHRTNTGTRLQGTLRYNSYNDENQDQNNFQNIGVGARAEHPLNQETHIFGDVMANTKSFDTQGGNDFKGARFNTGVVYNSPTIQADGGVRGRVQNSDVSALEYSRIIPNASVRIMRKRGNLNIRGEYENLAYGTATNTNDFNRGRLDLGWEAGYGRTSFIVISKTFPNNESFDNRTFRLQNRWTRSTGLSTRRSSAYIQYITYVSEVTQQSDYIELRFNNNRNSSTKYFDMNLFGRYWQEDGLDHQLNFFSRFGVKYSLLQIGPALGAQIMIDPDDIAIEKAGNTLRAGVDARVNAVIKKATIYGNVRVQKSIIYGGSSTSGGVDKRMPLIIEFDAGVQAPITTAVDLKIDASYFSVDQDFSNNLGPNVNQTITGLRFLAGVSYRFQGN